MDKLFHQCHIDKISLNNRFIRSATFTGLADKEGRCTPAMIQYYTVLARGEAGLIITGHTYVSREGMVLPSQIGIHSDGCIQGLKRLTQSVHEAGGSIILQLSHSGIFAKKNITGLEAFAVSTPAGIIKIKSPYRILSSGDIKKLIKDFGKAAARAKESGFDGIQLQAAHGYLLSQFLSPLFNSREDEYGGAIENRARIITEIIKEIQKTSGNDFPQLVKLNSSDLLKGGLTLEDSIKLGNILSELKISAIELSGGLLIEKDEGPIRKDIQSIEQEAYFKDKAKAFKASLKNMPIILVGGIRSLSNAKELVENGFTDFLSLSRPFICEPDIVLKFKQGLKDRSSCCSCKKCLQSLLFGKGVHCMYNSKSMQ